MQHETSVVCFWTNRQTLYSFTILAFTKCSRRRNCNDPLTDIAIHFRKTLKDRVPSEFVLRVVTNFSRSTWLLIAVKFKSKQRNPLRIFLGKAWNSWCWWNTTSGLQQPCIAYRFSWPPIGLPKTKLYWILDPRELEDRVRCFSIYNIGDSTFSYVPWNIPPA